MIAIASFDDPVWLVKLQRGASAYWRWSSSDAGVTIANDGEYVAPSPVIGFSEAGDINTRIERQEWGITLADPTWTYRNAFASNWMHRECSLYLRPTTAAPLVHYRRGECIGRQTTISNQMGRVLVLRFASRLGRNGNIKIALISKARRRP